MGTIFIDHFFGFLGLVLMVWSVALQLTYIRFKRTCEETTSKVEEAKFYKFFSVLKVRFKFHEQDLYSYVYKIGKSPVKVGEIPLLINPKDLLTKDNSVVITPLLRKLKIKNKSRVYSVLKGEKPIFVYVALMLLGLLLNVPGDLW